MKRFVFTLLVMCVFLGSFAQENSTFRFGFLSYETALQSMPDYAKAQKKLTDLKAQYQAETRRVEDEPRPGESGARADLRGT